MNINKKYHINIKKGGELITTNLFSFDGSDNTYALCDPFFSVLKSIYQVGNRKNKDADFKNSLVRRWLSSIGTLKEEEIEERLFEADTPAYATDKSSDTPKIYADTEIHNLAVNTFKSVINFFNEFGYTPSPRFFDTLGRVSNKTEYVVNYFALQNHGFATEISEKCKSPEWKKILKAITDLYASKTPETPINKRFVVYFGEPGGGKTTMALKLADKCIVCASDMIPSDLMSNFDFDEGKPSFGKSDFWIAMETGKTIVLDEFNMLPFETLRFLQGVLDNKDTINYKGNVIKIHKDFKVIATMNLSVGGNVIPLPSPLVDRAAGIKKFELSAEMLASILFG